MTAPRWVVGVSGASGSIYAARLLQALAARSDVTADVVFSRTGRLVWSDELDVDPASFGFPIRNNGDLAAPPASGSARYAGMVVVPCSAGSLARIAHGISADLLSRTADVTLKERRPLILVLRETPYSLIHIENMAAVTRAGAMVHPASPSFYSRPADIGALVDTVVARVMDHMGLDNALMPRWEGLKPRPANEEPS
jgi:4-hydroxy-3-polyprenylbenzoate decarboxylase